MEFFPFKVYRRVGTAGDRTGVAPEGSHGTVILDGSFPPEMVILPGRLVDGILVGDFMAIKNAR